MRKLAVWQVSKDKLIRVDEASIELEKQLETWITEDPSLLQPGLVIVGQQIQLEAGPLDLLGIDPQGRWVVIEIKKGDLDRKTIAQVVDYASCISNMSEAEIQLKTKAYLTKNNLDLDDLLEQRGALDSLDSEKRQVLLLVVGTGKAQGLERVVSFLASKHNIPISLILFEVFKIDKKRLLLAREVTEQNSPSSLVEINKESLSVEAVIKLAKKHNTYHAFQQALDIAKNLGLHVRPYKKSLMFAPPSNGSRMLFTLWAIPEKGEIKAFVGVEPFIEFFSLDRTFVENNIGPEGWKTFTASGFQKFMKGLKKLPIKTDEQSISTCD